MDIKDVKVGGIYYIPVEVISVDDEVQAYYAKRKEKGLWDDFDAVDMVTKDEIISTEVDDRVDFWKRDSESAHEEIRKLQERINRLEDSNGQYAKQIQQYNNALKDVEDKLAKKTLALARAEKKVSELQESAEKGLNAEKLEEQLVIALNNLSDTGKTCDILREENNKLKQEVESRMTDYKLMRDNNAVYLSRITTQNEVINALVEKIRRLEKENHEQT